MFLLHINLKGNTRQLSAYISYIHIDKNSSHLSFFYFTYEIQVQPNSTTKVMIQNDLALFDLICKNLPS